MEETTKSKCTAIPDSWAVTTVAVTPRALQRIEVNPKDLLIQMMDESVEKLNADAAQSKHKIFKVPDLLLRDQNNARWFEPEVVAIGPYHRGKRHLEPMEEHKQAAARKFICCSSHSIGEFYDKVKDVSPQARACYAVEFDPRVEEEFTLMLLFDGCFVLHFIERFVEGKTTEPTMSTHLHGFILRDMLLLENQLPPIVLSALMSLKPVKLHDFLSKVTETECETTEVDNTSCPDQLLNLYRMRYLKPSTRPTTPEAKIDWFTFRSVKELREIGIKFGRSETNHLNNINFSRSIVWSKLSLPEIVIDDLTESRFLNMIALEMCLGSEGGYGITSFVWFLDCLIDRADDVRELRDARILLNMLGSDEQVAELFNKLAANLSPDFKAYHEVFNGIAKHRRNKVRVSIYKFLHTHFSSPWTAIAFFAAVFLLAMSVIQTIYTVFPR